MEKENTNSKSAIVVKFASGIEIPYNESAGDHLIKSGYEPWQRLIKDFPGVEIKPLFTLKEQECLRSLVKRAEKNNKRYKDPGFLQYFRINVPESHKPASILDKVKGWKETVKSYIELNPVCANPLSSYNTNPRVVNQTYLNAVPEGIGIKPLWDSPTVAGSDGAGIRFIDIEKGWNLNHEDLIGTAVALIGTNSTPADIQHGTSVLGIVCANDNSKGCIGIAPNPSSVKVVSPVDSSLAGAIATAAANLNYGDVMLIEQQYAQTILSVVFYVPVEVTSAEADAIIAATSAGIIVIEPGGDGDLASSAINFDTYQNATLDLVLNPGELAFIDTGAIIVSASKSAGSVLVPGTHEKMAWAPFGARVDCYAWGENINTLDTNAAGTDNTAYTTSFGMTSGAAAIIAGAVMSIQGMVKARTNCRLSPVTMRSLLRNSAYGTNMHATGLMTLLGSYMPNLQLINSGYISALSVFEVTIDKTDATTFGGSEGTATANPVNGQSPYSYLWSNSATTKSISGLTAGLYNVEVTDDHGCKVTKSVTIGQPGDISATVGSTEITCHGANDGTITISGLSGGTPPYQYSIDNGATWSLSNSFSGLGPATYNVKIKDNTGFIKSFGAVTFIDPVALSAIVSSANSTAAGAHNGSISIISPAGGSGTYQYSIDGGATWQASGTFPNLGPETYNVQMRDAMHTGCSVILNPALTITEPAGAFTVTATATDVVKFGDATGAITLVVSGGIAPFTYIWSNGASTKDISGLKAGIYTVNVYDSSGAVVTRSATVKHIYCEITRNYHHGIVIRLLRPSSLLSRGTRMYKIMWRGYPARPPLFHPHVDVHLENITAGPITSVTIGLATWSVRSLSVPVSEEGDILVLPAINPLPVFPSGSVITVPVKLFNIKKSFPPFIRSQVLIAEFKMIIKNNSVDYSL